MLKIHKTMKTYTSRKTLILLENVSRERLQYIFCVENTKTKDFVENHDFDAGVGEHVKIVCFVASLYHFQNIAFEALVGNSPGSPAKSRASRSHGGVKGRHKSLPWGLEDSDWLWICCLTGNLHALRHKASADFIGFYLIVLDSCGFLRFYRILQDPMRSYWILLDSIGFCRIL